MLVRWLIDFNLYLKFNFRIRYCSFYLVLCSLEHLWKLYFRILLRTFFWYVCVCVCVFVSVCIGNYVCGLCMIVCVCVCVCVCVVIKEKRWRDVLDHLVTAYSCYDYVLFFYSFIILITSCKQNIVTIN